MSCRGVARGAVERDPDACDAPLPSPAGRNSADIDPPTYYVVTYVVARTVMATGVTDDLVTAGRLAGGLWAGAGLTALVLLCRTLGAGRGASAVAAATAAFPPGMLLQWHYVTPHACNLLVGVVVALLVLGWRRERLSSWALVVAGALPVLMATFLLAHAVLPDPDRDRRRALLGAATLLGSLAAVSVAWIAIRRHYALTDVAAHTEKLGVDSFEWAYVLNNVGIFLRTWSGGPSAGVTLLVVVWCYGSAVAALTRPAPVDVRCLSAAVLPVAAFGAVVFVVLTYVLLGQYFRIPERYGYTLVPVALALGALPLGRRGAVIAGGVVAAALLGITLAWPVEQVGPNVGPAR